MHLLDKKYIRARNYTISEDKVLINAQRTLASKTHLKFSLFEKNVFKIGIPYLIMIMIDHDSISERKTRQGKEDIDREET